MKSPYLLIFLTISCLGPDLEGAPGETPDLRTRKTGSDWPSFLGPRGNGKSTETGILLEWPEKGPPMVWRKDAGEGYSAPSVARGRLFLFDRIDGRARLSCMNAETGQLLWQTDYQTNYKDLYGFSDGPKAVPVVDEDRVYIHGVEGVIRCHRVSDGGLVWEVDTRSAFGIVQNFFGVGSSPVVDGDLLIVMVGGSPEDSPAIHSGEVKNNGSAVVAFEKKTGKVRYRAGKDLASYATPVLGEIAGERWGFAFVRSGLLAFRPQTGKLGPYFPWKAEKLESVNAGTPVVVGDTVFITESYGPGGVLLKMKPSGHEVVWRDPPKRGQSMACHWSTPVYHQGYLYGCSGQSSGNAELRCVEHLTGKIVWSKPGWGRTTLLYADSHLLVLSERGDLFLVEANPTRFNVIAEAKLGASKGDPKTAPLNFPVWNAPVLSNGYLYLRGKDSLVCLDISASPKK